MGNSAISFGRLEASIAEVLDNRDALVAERKQMSSDTAHAHYLFTEMVHPLIGAKITGGLVMREGTDGELMYPVLFVEQNGKCYSLVISADDEMNDGGRIIVERGAVIFDGTTFDRGEAKSNRSNAVAARAAYLEGLDK